MNNMSAQSLDRLITLNLRLTIRAWLVSVFQDSSCWFKRSLSVFKRLENTLDWFMFGLSSQNSDGLIFKREGLLC